MNGFAQDNTLVLDVSNARDTIRKDVYGGLLEDWGRDMYNGIYVGKSSSIPNTNGMRNDIIAGLKEIDIGVMQFPGGCKAEVYHWKNGVGTTRAGGDMVNGMGTDEYFQLCELVGSAPFIQANCKEGSPAEMKAWLEYINENFPDKLKYLGMGNEPWGGCYTGITVDAYLTNWYDKFNVAIPEVFNGKIVRIAAAGFNDENTTNFSWTDEVLRREIGNVEGISWHYYTSRTWNDAQRYSCMDFNEADYYGMLKLGYNIEAIGKKVMAIMDQRDPNNTISLQPDEWGAWNQAIPDMGLSYQQMTVREAQLTAQHLNYFNNNCKRIRMAQCAQPVNAIHSFFLTKNPPTTELIKTPAFYVYKLYVPHHNAIMVPSTLTCGKVNDLPVMTASASVKNGLLHISVNNFHATATQTLSITINGETYEKITGQIVNGPHFNSYNDYGKAEAVTLQTFESSNFSLNGNKVTVTLPAHSVVMLELTSPNVGTISNGRREKSQKISVIKTLGNQIVVKHGLASSTPVTLSLFTIDGKSAVPAYCTVAGTGSLKWRPNVSGSNGRIYTLRINAEGVNQSQKVILTE